MNQGEEPTVEEILAPVGVIDSATADRLHTRLTDAAVAAGLVDVAYQTIDTPVGVLLLAVTDQGLARVAYDCEDHDQVLSTLAEQISSRILRVPGKLTEVVRQFDEYFAGRRSQFDLPLDFRLSKGFRQQVLRRLPDIGYGRTASYAEIALAAGSPKAVRAVGTACATNPLPVVLPCHRVVRSDGSPGGYLGGLAAKRILLDLEAA